MIKTIFFDLDNVIINEDILYFKYYEILWMFLRKIDWNWTFEKIIETRINLVEKYNDPQPHLTIARRYISEKGFRDYKYQIQYFNRKNRNKYIKVIPGIPQVIQNLNHHYNLGLIANQSSEDYEFITKYKFSFPFQTIAINSNLNFSKPNSEIFLWALEKSKTNPEEAVMIGDRPDLDIWPAQRLGMNTIQTIFNFKTKGIFPQSSREKLYFNSLQKIQTRPKIKFFQSEPLNPVAENPREILTRISELDGKLSITKPAFLDLEQQDSFEEEKELEGSSEKGFWDIFKEIMTEV